MAKQKRKSADIRGRRQELEVRCPHCMRLKTIEIRRAGKMRRVYGATEKRTEEAKS